MKRLDKAKHSSFVNYGRKNLYNIGQEGAPCILVKTDAIFQLNYRTLRSGVKSVKIVLPGIY